MEFIKLPAGTFIMGRARGGYANGPHKVVLTRPFWIQEGEVTQAQWGVLIGNDPSHYKGDSLPVHSMTWNECQDFLEELGKRYKTQLTGKMPALPTEAQWEYACRAGTTTPWHFGASASELTTFGWVERNSEFEVHPVKTKRPNGWGIHDTCGNVSEWCLDWFGDYRGNETDPTGPKTGQGRVVRGSNWTSNASDSSSGRRLFEQAPYGGNRMVGFRVVLNESAR